MSDLDKEAFRLWKWFLKGAGGTPIAPDVKDHAFGLYMDNLRDILAGDDGSRKKALAQSKVCSSKTGTYSSAYAESDDREINIDDFDYAAEQVRNEYNQGLAGPLCNN